MEHSKDLDGRVEVVYIHAKNASATANIEDDFARKEVLVFVDEVTISVCADGVFEHCCVNC